MLQTPETSHPEANAARRGIALAGLAASASLAIGTIVAATVISIGIARADGIGTILDNESGVFVIALLLGTLFVAASITKAIAPRRDVTRQHGPRGHFSGNRTFSR